jgi:pimeloyl-ACP methyl ester carboxylesterase
MIGILKFLFLIALGFSALTHAFFWYESANGPHRKYLEKLSRGRVMWWIARGVLSGAGSILLVSLLFPLGLLRVLRFPSPSAENGLPPVVLVHGLYHNASGWILYRYWLRHSGFIRVYAFNYSSFGKSFDEILMRLESFVQQVESENPGRPVLMIGHSLGGLICRAFADAPANTKRVKAVVTLGSPHRGSKLAALSLGRLGQSLRYEGPLFKDLERSGTPAGSHRLALFSPMDTMVLPFEGLRIHDPAWNQLEVAPVGHLGMLFHRPTARTALEFLREAARGAR